MFRFHVLLYLLICYCDCLKRGPLTSVSVEHGKTATLSCCYVASFIGPVPFAGFFDDKMKKINLFGGNGKYQLVIRAGVKRYEICPTLLIHRFGASDAKDYICKLKNNDQIAIKILLKTTISVQSYAQALVIDKSAPTGKIIVQVHGSIFPELIWSRKRNGEKYSRLARFDGEKQTEGLPRYKIASDGSLYIQNLTKGDGGLYQLQYKNAKSSEKFVITVKVEEAPHILSNGTFVKSPAPNQYEVEVMFSGKPAPTLTCKTKNAEIKSTVTKLKDRALAKLYFQTNASYINCDVLNKHGQEKVRIELTKFFETTKPAKEITDVKDRKTKIIGIALVALVGIATISGLVWLIYSCVKKKKKRTTVDEASTENIEGAQMKVSLADDGAEDVQIWLKKERQNKRDMEAKDKRDSQKKRKHTVKKMLMQQDVEKTNGTEKHDSVEKQRQRRRDNKSLENMSNEITGQQNKPRVKRNTDHEHSTKERVPRKDKKIESESTDRVKNESESAVSRSVKPPRSKVTVEGGSQLTDDRNGKVTKKRPVKQKDDVTTDSITHERKRKKKRDH